MLKAFLKMLAWRGYLIYELLKNTMSFFENAKYLVQLLKKENIILWDWISNSAAEPEH